MKSACFMTFEGIDGCGKSTQLSLAGTYLRSMNIDPLLTREPGGTPVAESIRAILLSPENAALCPSAELLLYLAARAQHVHEKIVPALTDGRWVLCDRFQEATFAYQGYGRGLDIPTLERMNAFSTQGRSPDLTFIFDISVAEATRRLQASGKAPDRLEQGGSAFFQRIRDGYHALARQYPQRIRLVDAMVSISNVADVVRKEIDGWIRKG